MFVKRIELVGFKSFADRTDMEISPGVTAVVGPNGSGKSNIADAIRFVLGEQSIKMLRGARLEDVIFAGSDTRKPVNYAEIRLHLDNSDNTLPMEFSEVAVARRVYRSGESEFLINQTPCRLRDINELFMDTGMGREAYSVIGQGRIEEILSNKPEDRRGIFEEAAGIVKFKARRRETEKKLAEADQSLLRVRDLIVELESQLEPLAERSKVAIAYKELLGAANHLSATVITAEFDHLIDKSQALQVKIAELEQAAAMTIQEETAADLELIKLRAEFDESERIVERLQADLLDATATIEKHQGDQRVHDERHAYLLAHRSEQVDRLQQVRQEGQMTETELTEHDTRIAELETESARLREALKRQQEERLGKANLQKLRQQLADTRTELIDWMRKQATDRNELHNAELLLGNYRRQMERSLQEQANAERESLQLAQRIEVDRVELEKVRAQYLRQKQFRDNTLAELEKLQAERSVMTQKLAQREKNRLELSSRLRAMQGLQESRQGFANGPKMVLAAARDRRLTGIIGAVVDLIKVDQAVELAVETALGGSMQNVVTDTEKGARAAISYLKQQKAGRATFLPVATLSGRRLNKADLSQVESLPGFVGVAADLVQIDQGLTAVTQFLLGQVLVVSDLEAANQVAGRLQNRYRVVTLEGDVVHPGGSMTGGSITRRGASMLAMNRDIEALTKEMAEVERLLAKDQQELDAHDERIQERKRESDRLSELGLQTERSVREWEDTERLDVLASQQRTDSFRVLQTEWARQEQESRDSEAKITLLKTELEQVEASVTATESQIRLLEEQIATEESRQEEHQGEWTEGRVRLAELEEGQRSLVSSRRRLEQALLQNRQAEEKLSQDIQQTEVRLKESVLAGQALAEKYKHLQERLAGVEKALAADQEQRALNLQAFREQENRVEALRTKRRQQESGMHEQQLLLERVSVELESKEYELHEKHGVGIELARTRYPLTDPLPDARKKLQGLQQEMQKYEGVNLGDIQEYERLTERYQFLADQEADLQQAQTQLRELINEIDTEMGKRFSETFAQVKQSFQEVFKVLFGGGRADLRLDVEGDPLHAGIDILAEPPGKKLQSLTLLSGGERALTALALLFAILKVRPVPFCVLDEVEAALDEVNVARFSEFLKVFSSQTQFIVITHRRGTMEVADVLYGVTMQESGVSKLVSVKVLEEPVTA